MGDIFSVTVKDYMTKRTLPNSDFDFMERWNKNIPMPSTQMYGKKLRETKGMVYMQLLESNGSCAKWEGWIIKSAILSQRECSEAECMTFDKQRSFEIIVYIAKNPKTKHHFARVSLSSKNETVIDILKSRFQAKPDQNVWKVNINDVEDIIYLFQQKYHLRVVNPENYNRANDFLYPDIPLRTEYPPAEYKTTPYQYQEDGYRFGMERDRFLIADEQGTGKTMQSINIAVGKKKQFGLKHCLVICGVNSLKWNWVEEIETHSYEKAYVLGQRKKRSGEIYAGGNKEKIYDLNHFDEISEYFIIINAEALQNNDITKLLVSLSQKKQIGMAIVDEFHRMKNTECKQGKNTMKIKPDYRIALTGTPILNSPLDLYAIVFWLGYEKHNLYMFKQYYTRSDSDGNVTSFRHMRVLKENLQKIMLRRKKEDVLDLPEKVFSNIILEMNPEQQSIYNEIRNRLIEQIDLIELSKNPLAQIIRLRQATAYTGLLSSSVAVGVKLAYAKDLVEELVSENKKIIIFTNWAEVAKVCSDTLSEYNPLLITGPVPDEHRMSIMKEFQTNPDCKVIIGTIGAMGTGFTLTAAEAEIFLDEPWTQAVKDQAVDRAHRIGQKNNLTVYTLMCKNTIDERVHKIVETKGAVSDTMVDGKEPVNISIRYLLGMTDDMTIKKEES